MKKALLLTGIVGGLALAAIAPGHAQADTCQTDCGTPACWQPQVRVRPAMSRVLSIYCSHVTGAALLTPPANGTVSDVSGDSYGLHFTMLADSDAPRTDQAVFRLTGYDNKTADITVGVEVIPTSENSPPVCDGDHITQRSDGTGPVDVFMHPYCRDPDGDEFTIEGGGPGTHPRSPEAVAAGQGESNWPYRTATYSGTETTHIWATDVLGARSADADLVVTVGPQVDSLPSCAPNPTLYDPNGVFPVYSRPGAARRFGIICTDADADDFTPALTSRPRGVMSAFTIGDPATGFWGVERWIDATYVPPDNSLQPDGFSITASGARGTGPNVRMAIVPRDPPENGGGGCGWSPAQIVRDTPGVVHLSCDDDDGDPLTATVEGAPTHGQAGPPAIIPGRYGQSQITIPYTPDPGFTGFDCVKVAVTDGYGLRFDLNLDINVVAAPLPPPPVTLPVDPPPVTLPPPPPLPVAAASRVATDDVVRYYAQRALGTKDVQPVRGLSGAKVWAAHQLSKRALLRRGTAPAFFVYCPAGCRVRSTSALRPRAPARRSSAGTEAAVLTTGQTRVLSLTLSADQRARLARWSRSRATFKLGLRAPGARPATARRSLAIVARR
ncbi:MAG: hypothetical protein ACJ76Z_06675 [Thermoleophilaceae bacterium]